MGLCYPMYRTKPPALIGDQRVQIEAVELLAATEEGQLDDEARSDDDAAELLDEAADRVDGSAGREDVVVDHDARASRDQLRVQLERVLAVLEHVASADGLRRQLSRPARRDEADAGLDCDRRPDPEAAGLRAEDDVDLLRAHPLGQLAHRRAQRLGVCEERRHVLEADAGSREILDLADLRAEV